jgi:hypothetical protein
MFNPASNWTLAVNAPAPTVRVRDPLLPVTVTEAGASAARKPSTSSEPSPESRALSGGKTIAGCVADPAPAGKIPVRPETRATTAHLQRKPILPIMRSFKQIPCYFQALF